MKKILILILVALLPLVASAYDVEINEENFPDANFRSWVLSQEYGADGVLTTEEIANVEFIEVPEKNIQSLRGIEFFTAIVYLVCFNNQLTSLNLSHNSALKAVDCHANQLTKLNMMGCTSLEVLACFWNRIKGEEMDALIESLPNVSRGRLEVALNKSFDENEQNEMTTVQVAAAKAKGWIPMYNDNSEYKGIMAIEINETNFPDYDFRNYIRNLEYYYNSDGVLTEEEIADIRDISIPYKGVESLKGIEYFTALIHLDCSNNRLTSLDLSKNTALLSLDCSSNLLTSLNISGCVVLRELFCFQNQIKGKKMDALVESLPNVDLGEIRVIYNNEYERNVMNTWQVAAAKAKGWIPLYYNQGDWLEYEGSETIEGIEIDEESFPDTAFRKWIKSQSYGTDNFLTNAEIAEITSLSIYDLGIQSLNGIEFLTALTRLNCSNNQLTTLDLSKNTALTYLECSKNQLKAINVSGCTELKELLCFQNQIKDEGMDALVDCLPTVNQGELYVIWYEEEQNTMTPKQVSAAKAKGWIPYAIAINDWGGYDLQEYVGSAIAIDESNFPDENFRRWLYRRDYGADGVLTNEEIASIDQIDVSGWGIQSLKGIEYFPALFSLNCSINFLSTLDLSQNRRLHSLVCYSNQLTTLDLSKNSELQELYCFYNQIKGEGMDALVESLPKVYRGNMYVISLGIGEYEEGNEMSEAQVAAAKAKGWFLYYTDELWELQEYTGPDGIVSLNPDSSPVGTMSIYDLQGRRIQQPQKSLYIVNGKKVLIK